MYLLRCPCFLHYFMLLKLIFFLYLQPTRSDSFHVLKVNVFQYSKLIMLVTFLNLLSFSFIQIKLNLAELHTSWFHNCWPKKSWFHNCTWINTFSLEKYLYTINFRLLPYDMLLWIALFIEVLSYRKYVKLTNEWVGKIILDPNAFLRIGWSSI